MKPLIPHAPPRAATAHPISLAERYVAVRAATERLCEPLSPEDFIPQSMTEASPILWHLAHTSWFFETFVLAQALPEHRPFHPEFGYLFNSYYNAVGDRLARGRRGMITRPGLGVILEYRRHVDESMRALLQGEQSKALDPFHDVVVLGLQHEQQHQELMLTDVKHLFSLNPLHPVYLRSESAARTRASPLRYHRHDEGLHWIGHAGEGFAFDNETPRHRVFAQAFEIASRPVTCGEYTEFIEDRGYHRPELWLSDGWDAVVQQAWEAPLYWERRERAWWQFTLSGMRAVDAAESVCHVSFYEADAFARWKNARLPRESEWEIAARCAAIEGNFVESGALNPCTTPKSADDGPAALFGDVWEWTMSPYTPYPGYAPPAGALGEYNGKFMCNQMVLRGGSCVSPRDHLRVTYRNFFTPATRWQFSGIRLARDA